DSATTVSTADSGASAALANGADAVPTTFALNALAGGALDGAAGNQTYTVNLAFSQASAGASLSGTTLTVNLTAASGTATLKDVESAIHGSAATTGLDATVVNGDSATTVTSAESGTTATLTNGADATPAALTLSAVANGALDGLAGNGTYTVDLVFGANSAGATLSGKTLTVSVTQASGTATLSNIQSAIHGARGTTGIDAAVSTGGSDTVSSRNSGQTAVLANGAPAATAAGLQKDVTFSLTGDQGTQTFSFTAGTLIAQVQNAIHALADATGVDATLTNATTLTLNSTDSGSAAFVDLKVLSEAAGGTIATDLGGSSSHQLGTNFAGTINGVQANGDGQSLSVDTAALSMKMGVASGFTGAIAFNIDSGGALFQIGANVVSDSQARIGIQKVTTDSLGGVDGTLSNISSQGSADLAKDPATASKIVNEAIAEVSSLRGRLGAFQQATLETNITTLNDSITNLTSAQSSIQDADFAAESANVTRAQVLAQSGTAVLAIANKSPQNVLTLLQGL
ncbi:MAG: flagellin, partial [Thermoguttaceae bacterium]